MELPSGDNAGYISRPVQVVICCILITPMASAGPGRVEDFQMRKAANAMTATTIAARINFALAVFTPTFKASGVSGRRSSRAGMKCGSGGGMVAACEAVAIDD